MSATQNPATESDFPRFSAFAVMIAFLLIFFGLMSRIDRLLPRAAVSPGETGSSSEVPRAAAAGRSVVTVLGGGGDNAPVSAGEAASESAPGSREQQAGLPQPSSARKRPQGNPDTVICPPKPRKGDKLTEVAEALPPRVEVPALAPVTPERQPKEYRPAPSVVRMVRHRRYRVKADDTLWSIARTQYGAGSYWKAIVRSNPGLQPDALPVGKSIVLPAREEVVRDRVALAQPED